MKYASCFPATYRVEILEGRIAPAAAVLPLDDGLTVFLPTGTADQLGRSVSPAGDVNNDGRPDFILGATTAENGTDTVRRGAAYVIFGVDGGLPAELAVSTLDGTNGFAFFGDVDGTGVSFGTGISVAGIGDINDDGIDDVAVGAPFYDTSPSLHETGALYVIFGRSTAFPAALQPSDLNGATGFVLTGAATGDKLGYDVRPAGDLNDDGIADLVVTADGVQRSGSQVGAAYVLFGKSTAFAAAFSVSTLTGPTGFSVLGYSDNFEGTDSRFVSLGGAADFNDDGIDDLLVGFPISDTLNDRGVGHVGVIFGKTSGWAPFNLQQMTAANGFVIVGDKEFDRLGFALSVAGDINADGIPDILAAAVGLDLNTTSLANVGGAYVIFGSDGGFGAGFSVSSLNGTNGFRMVGEKKDFSIGTSVTGGGDLNGDGIDDLVVSAFNAKRTKSAVGEIYVLFGDPDGFPASFSTKDLDGQRGYRLNAPPGTLFSPSNRIVPDVNGDGFDDLLIGLGSLDLTPASTTSGAVLLFPGFDSTLTPNASGKSATYIDIDGDIVTVTTSKGRLSPSQFVFSAANAATGGAQLQKVTFGAEFTGATITFSAKRGPAGGNSFVNVGFLDATGVDLGAVTIGGDLGLLRAGTTNGDAKVPALKSLTAQTVGVFDTSTQAAGATQVGVFVHGAIPKLTIKNDLRAPIDLADADGLLGATNIGGSMLAISATAALNAGIAAEAGIKSLTVGGDVRADGRSLTIFTPKAIGTIAVKGTVVGESAGLPVNISASTQAVIPEKGLHVVINSITIGGTAAFLHVQAGLNTINRDASINSITVGGNWFASNVSMASVAGPDGLRGTDDDFAPAGAVIDMPGVIGTLGSFTVKGQAFGNHSSTADMFGVVAEKIGKAKVGTRTFAFTAAGKEAFYAAPTAPGAGVNSPVFDFTIRELGSALGAVAFGGPNLTISTDGKTATFIDVDGDLVTVKRTAGAFVAGDFNILAAASGGGQLRTLTVTAAPNGAAVGLTITAKASATAGNGFVNVGAINAPGVTLGAVTVGGDLARLNGGQAPAAGKPGIASLTAFSLGALGTSTGSGTLGSNLVDGIGKLMIKSDVVSGGVMASGTGAKIGSVTVGGELYTAIQASADIGAVKITGSLSGAIQAGASLGAVTIGGDIYGNGSTDNLRAIGQTTPGKVDLAIKSLTIKGSLNFAVIATANNADASIGAISVGRGWMASVAIIGVDYGPDGRLATADDVKAAGTDTARFSSIASILIKGQAFGTTQANDHGGIVSETIGKATIGKAVFKFAKGARSAGDVFAGGPTGPGFGGLPFDFYLRELAPLP